MPTARVSKVILYKGVPLNEKQTNVVDFPTLAAQTAWFNNYKYAEREDLSYVREDGDSYIRWSGSPGDSGYDIDECNMLAYINATPYENKIHYAFIKNVLYKNDGVRWIYFEDDYWSTWLFEKQLMPCFVEREHSVTDNIGDNTVEENIDIGNYLVTASASLPLTPSNGMVISSAYEPQEISVFSTLDPEEEPTTRIYGSCFCYWGNDSYARIGDYGDFNCIIISPLNGVSSAGTPYDFNGIITDPCLNGCPINGFYYGFDSGIIYVGNTGAISERVFAWVKDLVSINLRTVSETVKLQCLNLFLNSTMRSNDITRANSVIADKIIFAGLFPNLFHYSATTNVKTNIYGGNYYNLPNLTNYKSNGNAPNNNKLFTYPYASYFIRTEEDEKKLKNELFNDSTRQIIVDFVAGVPISVYAYPVNYRGLAFSYADNISVNKFPITNTNKDTLSQWIANNQSGFVLDVAKGLPSVVGTGYAYGGTSGAALTGIAYIAQKIATTKDHNHGIIPSQKGTPSNTLMTGYGGINYGCYGLKPEYVDIIDDYFTKYGYATNLTKVPNHSSRPYWNFIKTTDSNVTGNIPPKASKAIMAMLDNGVTIWHNGNVGNYNRDNSPITKGDENNG